MCVSKKKSLCLYCDLIYIELIFLYFFLLLLAKSQGGKKQDTFGMNESDWNVYKEIVSVYCVEYLFLSCTLLLLKYFVNFLIKFSEYEKCRYE